MNEGGQLRPDCFFFPWREDRVTPARCRIRSPLHNHDTMRARILVAAARVITISLAKRCVQSTRTTGSAGHAASAGTQPCALERILFPPRRISVFVKLGDECSQSFCSAERRESSIHVAMDRRINSGKTGSATLLREAMGKLQGPRRLELVGGRPQASACPRLTEPSTYHRRPRLHAFLPPTSPRKRVQYRQYWCHRTDSTSVIVQTVLVLLD